MGAPSSYPDWDTNATNTIPLVAGHITDGWDTDEVPDSDEMNEWMMLVGLWIRYLSSGGAARSVTVPAAAAQLSSTVGDTDSFNSAGEWFPQNAGDVLIQALPLQLGSELTSVDCWEMDGIFGGIGSKFQMKLWKVKRTAGAGGDPTPTQIGATQTSGGNGVSFAEKLTISGLTEMITDIDTSYFITINVDLVGGGVNTSSRVCSFTWTFDPPTA